MKKQPIYIGKQKVNMDTPMISGSFVELAGEKYYKIANHHQMPDFFISIVSDSDHWMFISSNGSLSAGRKDRDNALFPYYTVDKIHDYKGKTGSRSYFLIEGKNGHMLWEPFMEVSPVFYKISRNIYKNIYGNKILFEEVNHELGLSFRYEWSSSEKYGFVKRSSLLNLSDRTQKIAVLDGIQNMLPHGLGYYFQNEYSNLADAYKKSERIPTSTLGLFMLSAIPVDRAEPSEALFTTTVWSVPPVQNAEILLSDEQIPGFKAGLQIKPEHHVRARRAAYFQNFDLRLEAHSAADWYTIAEINQSSTEVANLNHHITSTKNIVSLLQNDINKGTENLKLMVSQADGFQLTNTPVCYARHYTNTLFNIMRGGVFVDQYQLYSSDFKRYVWQINRNIAKEYKAWLDQLPKVLSQADLLARAEETQNADLQRLILEYLPLTFSRRHGDPSRPWNRFSIETKNPDGSVRYNYEGNWRDIFQNWEALCYAFPQFTEGIISRFVNASTVDGYNPYRIMRDGMDWEVPDPDDPWAYIGYWGDHQIIYLQKLLEVSDCFHPGKLDTLLGRDIFTYAHVPYRLKAYDEMIQDPKDTVVFDFELNNNIMAEAEQLGADAKLLKSKSGDQIYHVNLTEKILATLLSKLSNFIPEAGIWMNTQRPEWNDANNALVGNGASMVTLYYLHRFLKFWANKFNQLSMTSIWVSKEIAILFEEMHRFFEKNSNHLNQGFSDADRLYFAEQLGKMHTRYRQEIYACSFSAERKQILKKEMVAFIQLCLKYTDQTIRANRRKDSLYHAYNLISIKPEGISIRHLYEMLEGQVAVLSSGLLSVTESLQLLDALKNSSMFRKDQYSYMLYPNRELPAFVDKNTIPKEDVEASALLRKLLQDKETSIIEKDDLEAYHFNGTIRNSDFLELALDQLMLEGYSHLVESERKQILDLYEKVFDHQSFTGRSGTFYGYEGLGSIYWHMVSKLLLAVQECFFRAVEEGADKQIRGRLKDHYYEIKAGIGLYKSPELYGAFPTDAYSHTPANAGVKQPGLTGQVKEDVISRMGEFGLKVRNGMITIDPALINPGEILETDQTFEYYDVNKKINKLLLKEGQMAFTFCAVPIILESSTTQLIRVFYPDGGFEEFEGDTINLRISQLIFSRSALIERVEVKIKL